MPAYRGSYFNAITSCAYNTLEYCWNGGPYYRLSTSRRHSALRFFAVRLRYECVRARYVSTERRWDLYNSKHLSQRLSVCVYSLGVGLIYAVASVVYEWMRGGLTLDVWGMHFLGALWVRECIVLFMDPASHGSNIIWELHSNESFSLFSNWKDTYSLSLGYINLI